MNFSKVIALIFLALIPYAAAFDYDNNPAPGRDDEQDFQYFCSVWRGIYTEQCAKYCFDHQYGKAGQCDDCLIEGPCHLHDGGLEPEAFSLVDDGGGCPLKRLWEIV
ncbi:hypothetical protein BUALT_Bualt01G0061500 [Buddleja alternifolia]|uniref:Uncharacterized protein n=1 Tax=Buddleja alternifolia TaxID=168488 RepID=A0AAV6Y746_9LAMI|nr:hypothetical protein BUALT_Bualt01G0061500 [Buddleja alternifolia]